MSPNALQLSPDTLLSAPDEWVALMVGVGLAGVLIYVTETRWGYALAAVVVFAGTLPFLPLDVVREWHYWPAVPVAVFLLALYRWGPDEPVS